MHLTLLFQGYDNDRVILSLQFSHRGYVLNNQVYAYGLEPSLYNIDPPSRILPGAIIPYANGDGNYVAPEMLYLDDAEMSALCPIDALVDVMVGGVAGLTTQLMLRGITAYYITQEQERSPEALSVIANGMALPGYPYPVLLPAGWDSAGNWTLTGGYVAARRLNEGMYIYLPLIAHLAAQFAQVPSDTNGRTLLEIMGLSEWSDKPIDGQNSTWVYEWQTLTPPAVYGGNSDCAITRGKQYVNGQVVTDYPFDFLSWGDGRGDILYYRWDICAAQNTRVTLTPGPWNLNHIIASDEHLFIPFFSSTGYMSEGVSWQGYAWEGTEPIRTAPETLDIPEKGVPGNIIPSALAVLLVGVIKLPYIDAFKSGSQYLEDENGERITDENDEPIEVVL